MYNVEVLSKFPVVQHFPFGSLFSWDRDPNAISASPSIHTASQPQASSGRFPRQSFMFEQGVGIDAIACSIHHSLNPSPIPEYC
jgi:hypothetical protein